MPKRNCSLITDPQGILFLQWCLPRLGLRWPGFRKVRGRVYKRLKRRLHELGLSSLDAYKTYLTDHHEEWAILRSFCWMPITRFYRDRSVFELLATEILPQLVELVIDDRKKQLRCWSAGCASGEEPHTLAILWQHRFALRYPAVEFCVVGTDIDPQAIQRAQRGCYHWSTMKELPAEWRAQAFVASGEELCLKDPYRSAVTFLVQDLRESVPDGVFELILCRNLAFTYFDETTQRETLERLTDQLVPGGALVIGKLESLPQCESKVEPWSIHTGVYRKPFVQAVRMVPSQE
jgi:chemotaxis protein methyltransferase CheR